VSSSKLDATRKFEESIITSGILGKFFRYVISRLTTKHNVGPLRLPDGSITVDPAVKATLLSKYFDSLYTFDNGDLPTTSAKAAIDPDLSSITFNPTTEFKTVKQIQHKIWSRTSYSSK